MSLQRKVARSQTKGEMIKAVEELRITAQSWKALYDEQVIKMARMGEDFAETFQQAVEEIDMAKAISYMMLWNSPHSSVKIPVDSIEKFNEISAAAGEWDVLIDGGDGEDFVITLTRLDPEEEEEQEEEEDVNDA